MFFVGAVHVTFAEESAHVHVNVYVEVAASAANVSAPLAAFDPDQEPDAVQLDAAGEVDHAIVGTGALIGPVLVAVRLIVLAACARPATRHAQTAARAKPVQNFTAFTCPPMRPGPP